MDGGSDSIAVFPYIRQPTTEMSGHTTGQRASLLATDSCSVQTFTGELKWGFFMDSSVPTGKCQINVVDRRIFVGLLGIRKES
jgi:hypothetical protein